MAKKMLINADMLLATPRRNESKESFEPKTESEIVQVIPPQTVVSPTPSTAATISIPPIQIEKTAVLQIVEAEKKSTEITSVQRGLKAGETRATFIVKEEALEKIKAIAYWDRQNIKDIVQMAIEGYIQQYENAKGTIQPIP